MYLGCIAEVFNGATGPGNICPVTEALMGEWDAAFAARTRKYFSRFT